MGPIGSMTVLAAAGILFTPALAGAQGVALTPMAGAYIPASDLYELRESAEAARVDKEAAFGLALALELGPVRGTLAYATGATVNRSGVDETTGRLGDGSVLTATLGVALRPVPRILGLQPYLLAGGGLKRESYSFDEADGVPDPGSALEDDFTDPAAHIGLGMDLLLGHLGVVLEVSDFVTLRDGDIGPHDAFVLVGLRLAL